MSTNRVVAWVTSPPAGPTERAQAANVSRDEYARLKVLPVARLREIVAQQIELTQSAFAQVSKVPWYDWLNPITRGANYVRWSHYLDPIENARKVLDQADAESAEAEKRLGYLNAYLQARATAESLAKDFKELGQTRLLVVVDMGGAAVKQTVTEAASTVADWVKEHVEEAKDQLREGGRWMVIGTVLLLALLLARR